MKPLRALIVEDSERDAALLLRELRKADYSPVHRRVETAEEMISALDSQEWDIVLSDYVLPAFDGLVALALLQDKGLDLPFIIVSGQIGEDIAVEAMKAGAHDYIMKSNLKRLAPAIERELAEAESRKMRKKAEDDLRCSELELHALAQRLLQVQEEERRNIARELHDEIGQKLTLLKMLLDRTGQLSGDKVPPDLADAQQMTTDLLNVVRGMSLRLRPSMLDDLGLLPTLQSHLETFTDRTGIRVDFRHRGLDGDLGQDVRTVAYRIVQEALTNVVRYAKASQVNILAEVKGKTLDIQIQDNGSGFDTAAVPTTSVGLRGMQERARYLGGSFFVDSATGKGTRILVKLPLR
jgi:signal transduction histidine kinase